MKTNDFIKKVEKLGFTTKERRNSISVHDQDGFVLVNVRTDAWLGLDSWLVVEELFDLAVEYAKTPVEKRGDIELTDDEKIILKNISSVYKWIARDHEEYGGHLWVCKNDPKCWDDPLVVFDHLFQSITFENSPHKISGLISTNRKD